MYFKTAYQLSLAAILSFILGFVILFAIQGIYFFPVLAIITTVLQIGAVIEMFSVVTNTPELTQNQRLQLIARIARYTIVLALVSGVIVPPLLVILLGVGSIGVSVALFFVESNSSNEKKIIRVFQVLLALPLIIPFVGIVFSRIENLVPKRSNFLADIVGIGLIFLTIPIGYYFGLKYLNSNLDIENEDSKMLVMNKKLS